MRLWFSKLEKQKNNNHYLKLLIDVSEAPEGLLVFGRFFLIIKFLLEEFLGKLEKRPWGGMCRRESHAKKIKTKFMH